MLLKIRLLAVCVVLGALGSADLVAEKKTSDGVKGSAKIAVHGNAVLWKAPVDLESRNLLYGSGGEKHRPEGPFTFVKEDMSGTNPKFTVKDGQGKKWKVKMGAEAKPEVAASRFVWATGYFTYDEYFLDRLKVEGMPGHMHRGQKFVGADGTVREVRMKRDISGEAKDGTWRWKDEPFVGTPELNALRTLMAVLNNWDLKTENNTILVDKKTGEQMYLVSDLGASFGTTGLSVPLSKARGNLGAYEHSKFITRTSGDQINFGTPSSASPVFMFDFKEYVKRLHIRSVGRGVPRADAKQMGALLARLSPKQIRDAFRAAGYAPEVVEGFSKAVEARIRALQAL